MAKLHVLVVDDDDLVRAQLEGLLSSAEHIVHTLPSAIGVTRAIVQHQIDVVAIDVMMPSLPGDKLAALLRQNPRFKHLGVVLISGRPLAELNRIAAEVSADAVVSKADAKSQFVTAIERAAKARSKGGNDDPPGGSAS
jgi:CheY-like chemotaxis protein